MNVSMQEVDEILSRVAKVQREGREESGMRACVSLDMRPWRIRSASVLAVLIVVTVSVFQSQGQEFQYFRVAGSTGSVVSSFSSESSILIWSNTTAGADAFVQTTEDLIGDNWVSYLHTLRSVSNTFESANVDHPARVMKTGQTQSQFPRDDGEYRIGVEWPSPRFVVQLNTNAVLDNLTGLVWARDANRVDRQAWSNALLYCEGLDLAGYNDWRLPNIREFLSVVDWGRVDPAFPDGHPFASVQGFYWTSTTYARNTDQAWTLETGVGFPRPRAKDNVWYVWPVRAMLI